MRYESEVSKGGATGVRTPREPEAIGTRDPRRPLVPHGLAKAIIFGSGGHGRVVLDILRCRGDIAVAGFVDDACEAPGHEVRGVPVLGDSRILSNADHLGITHFVVAIGDNQLRAEKFEQLSALGLEPMHAAHPTVVIAEDVKVRAGLQAMARAIVNTGAVLGRNVILNTGCSVDHDCRIGDNAFVGPGAHLGGAVTIRRGAFVGIGASVIPGVTIGERSVIGAGAAVVDDVPAGVVSVGVPARVLRRL